MSKDALDVMAEVRERRGLEPINPHQIEGFGPGTPPAPKTSPAERDVPSATEKYGEPLEPEAEREVEEPPVPAQPSPLVSAGRGGRLPVTPPEMPLVPVFDVAKATEDILTDLLTRNRLTVLGPEAILDKHPVNLTAGEQAQIERVVVSALQRELRARQAEIAKLVPRKPRSDRGKKRAPKKETKP